MPRICCCGQLKGQVIAGRVKEPVMRHPVRMFLFTLFLFSLLSVTASQARDVTLQWDAATDTTVTGYKIHYNTNSAAQPFSGTGAVQGASPIDVKKLTGTVLNGLDPAKSYYFAVTAYNASGTESSYSNIATVTEAIPPTVAITAPASNAAVSGTVSVTASAADNVGVTKVEFYLNGILKVTDTSTPYLYSLSSTALAAGTNTLMAKAYDAAGNVAQSSDVFVSLVIDSSAPVVSLTAPANNASVSGTTTISANASDNVGVTKVEFYNNGALLYATNVSPFNYSWNTTSVANGSYSLVAKAYDNTGNQTQSGTILVTVNNPVADTVAPTASVTAPAASATVSGIVAVSAAASDNVGVSRVEFYINSVLVSTDSASPYSYSWNSTSAANGSSTLRAIAYDAAGNSGQSATVTVTVNNPVSVPVPAGSIWAATVVPDVIDAGPDSAVELGVRFRSDSAGYINGIRFYKASTNTGIHAGNLWDNSGKLLATATFTNESASGWQQVNFATPVAIAANTVYVASYHTNVGHYSASQSFFAGKGVDNPPLHALADGISGASGAYAYGSSSSFPNQSWNSSNYWVDVAFSMTATASADTIAPFIRITSPLPNSSVKINGTVYLTVSTSDNVAVSKVEYYINGLLDKTVTLAPFSYSIPAIMLQDGSYNKVYAKAYDAAGNISKSATIKFTIK